MITVSLCLYMLGMLLVLSILEIEEGGSPVIVVILAICWPLLTLHMVLCDIFFPDEE